MCFLALNILQLATILNLHIWHCISWDPSCRSMCGLRLCRNPVSSTKPTQWPVAHTSLAGDLTFCTQISLKRHLCTSPLSPEMVSNHQPKGWVEWGVNNWNWTNMHQRQKDSGWQMKVKHGFVSHPWEPSGVQGNPGCPPSTSHEFYMQQPLHQEPQSSQTRNQFVWSSPPFQGTTAYGILTCYLRWEFRRKYRTSACFIKMSF